MGLTIENKHSSIDLSYTGFARLRTKIAYLHSKELGKFYDELVNAIPMFGKEREIFLKDYEKRLSTIDEELNVSHYLLDFLYADDYEATMSVKHCRRIWNIIKNCDEDFSIGYVGKKDCAMFFDFKRIVKECRDKNIQMYWF